MSYFDHVQCHTCGARMNPEQIVGGRGEMPSCPHCNAQLNLTDLFGVKDSFVGMHDDAGNDHSLDDLVGGDLYDGRYVDGRAPAGAPPSTPPQRANPPRDTAPAPSAAQLLRGLPGPTGRSSNAMVRRDAPAEPEPSGRTPSALDLLREMKKKR